MSDDDRVLSLPEFCDEDRVLSLPEFSELAGISVQTLRRLIADGTGPIVTQVSKRRLGIRIRHGREWLNSRAFRPRAA